MNLLATEVKKSILNRSFCITLIIATVISLVNAYQMIEHYYWIQEKISSTSGEWEVLLNPNLPMVTLYNHWIGGEFTTLSSSLFYMLLPLLSPLPYGLSYFVERKNGYVRNVFSRGKKVDYFKAKYLAVFISGGLVVIIPLLINILTVSMFVPAYKPDIFYDIYYAVPMLQMWSYIFYTFPFMYVVLFLILDFVFSGLIATISLALTFWIKNRFVILLLPFFIFLAVNYSERLMPNSWGYELSPIYFLRANSAHAFTNFWIVMLEGGLLLLTTFFITIRKGKMRDVL